MRVALRNPMLDDVDAIWRTMQDPETLALLPALPVPFQRQDAIDFVTSIATPNDQAIIADGAFAGMIRKGADIGYWLSPDFRGRGIVQRAAQMAIIAQFGRAPQQSITAHHLAGNEASRRLLLGLGFRDTGPAAITRAADGAELPARLVDLTAADFAAGLTIRTPRCRLTAMTEADLPALHAIVTRPEVARMLLRFHARQSVEEVAAVMRPAMDPLSRPVRLAIRLNGVCIGTIGVAAGQSPSIYYFLSPEVAGQGLASEILPVFCDTVQDWYGLDRLLAEVFQDNPASRRVLEKAGFTVTETGMMPSAGRNAPAQGWMMQRG